MPTRTHYDFVLGGGILADFANTWRRSLNIKVPLGKGLPLLESTFIERPNQFTIIAEYNGKKITGAMADRGRLLEVLVPGRTLLMEHRDEKTRKTPYQILAARGDDGALISLDTHLPNKLVKLALSEYAFGELPPYTSFRAEKKIGSSRFDFMLELADGGRLLMEVKSVGRLGADKIARFPDAPTARGARHVKELVELMQEERETQSALLFLVQGDDATHVEIDKTIDPHLHETLLEAQAAGLHIFAHLCHLDETGLSWGVPTNVLLSPDNT